MVWRRWPEFKDDERDLVVAIDRSKGRRIVVYSIVVSCVRYQYLLVKYSKVFKHCKDLSKRERRVYLPKALRLIEKMVDQGVLLGLDVVQSIGVLLSRVESIRDRMYFVFVDDVLYSKNVVKNVFRDIFVLPEYAVRKVGLLKSCGLSSSALKTLVNIADNLAYYVRWQVEETVSSLSKVKRKLPLKWTLSARDHPCP